MLIDKMPEGLVNIPSSKSIAHRAIICSYLSGMGRVLGLDAYSLDLTATESCMRLLMAKDDSVLECEESGSTLRFLIPLALAVKGGADFSGKGRLMERPLEQYLEAFGNKVSMNFEDGLLKVRGSLDGGVYRLRGDVSSQFISGLLLALPLVPSDSCIELTTKLESRGYVDLTLDVMKKFGIDISVEDDYKRFLIKGSQKYIPYEKSCMEGDFSQAAFFLVAAALGADVSVCGLNPNSKQGDAAILDILKCAGADVVLTDGTAKVVRNGLKAVDIDVSDIPDLVPPLVSLLCFCEGKSRIYNASRLRLKESDRLSALATEFKKLGASIEEGEDYLVIEGVSRLNAPVDIVKANSHNDHRIAMAVAVASMRSDNRVDIEGHEAVNKSYPKFWDDFLRRPL